MKSACEESGGKYGFKYGYPGDYVTISGNVSENKMVTYTVPNDVSLIGKRLCADFSINYYHWSSTGPATDFTEYYYLNFEADEVEIAGILRKRISAVSRG